MKPYLMNTLEVKESEQEIYEFFLGDTKSDIPIIIEFDRNNIFGNLDTRFLKENYNQLEDYESDEVTILFKLISHKSSTKVTIFDPLKDFIKLNRVMRRSIETNKNPKEFSPIIIDGPASKIEILAIYQ